MKVDVLAAALAARRAAGSGVKAGPSWQHQMQRAQSAGWFHRSDRLPSTEAGSGRSLAREQQPSAVPGRTVGTDAASTFASRWQGMPTPDTGFARVNTPGGSSTPAAIQLSSGNQASGGCAQSLAVEMPAEAPFSPFVLGAIAPAPEAVPEVPAASESPSSRSACQAGKASDSTNSPRIHVEEGPEGLQLWLGLDGTPAQLALRTGELAAQLVRQCAQTGIRLASVTCNGAPLLRAGPLSDRSREDS